MPLYFVDMILIITSLYWKRPLMDVGISLI